MNDKLLLELSMLRLSLMLDLETKNLYNSYLLHDTDDMMNMRATLLTI